MAAPLRLHFSPCCVSLCLLRSTFLWKPLPQRSQPNGLYPVCFLLCVMRLELWLNAFPHTWHLCGFSPEKHKWGNIFFLSLGLHVIQHQLRLFIIFTTDFHGIYAQFTHRLFSSRLTQQQQFHFKSAFSPLACVDESVLLHVWLLVEPLPAVLAGVRPSVGVDEQVRRQGWRPFETFAAYFAVETSFLKTWTDAAFFFFWFVLF